MKYLCAETVSADYSLRRRPKMDRADCVEKIIEYVSGLNQIAKCAKDSIKMCDVVSAVDCIHKFYTAYNMVSAAIIMFNGVLTEDEILKYHATLTQIAKEFREESVKMAKKCKCFGD
jgi:hypothetical protein